MKCDLQQPSDVVAYSKLAPIILWLMISVISVSYGFQYRVPENVTHYYFIFASAIFFLLAFALAISILYPKITLCFSNALSALSAQYLAIAITLTTLLSGFYFYSGSEYIPTKIIMVVTVSITVTLTVIRRCKEALWVLAIAGTGLFVCLSLFTPLDVNAANMLPIIGAGCDSLLNGENPFLRVYPEIATAPLYYLPFNVLPYCPLQFIGLDLRWLNVVIFLILMIVLAKIFNFAKKPEILGLTFLPLLISPMILQAGHYGHLWFYWFGLVIMASFLWRGKMWLVAILIGLLLLTRQTYVFIAGLLGASLLSTFGWKACVKYGAVVLGVTMGGFLIIYFLTNVHPVEFYSAVRSASEVTHKATSNPVDQISLSGFFVMYQMRPILMEMQMALAVIVGIYFILFTGQRTTHVLIILIGLGYIFIISMSVFIHRYFYIPGFILIAYGLALQLQAQNPKRIALESQSG